MRWVLVAMMTWLTWAGPVGAADKLVIKGSNTFGEKLGPRLIQEFNKQYPGVVVELETKGSATGFAALTAGECDIASASRPPTEDETRLAQSRGVKLATYTVGYYGIAVVVSDRNPVRGLSDVQVRGIFTGVITNWSAVGGVDAPITIYIPDAKQGTYLGFQELAMDKKPYASTVRSLATDEMIAEAVKRDSAAIGYVALPMAKQPELHGVRINGVVPTDIAVHERLYPYARQLWLFTDARRESPAARQFIRFVHSRRGQEVVELTGFVRRSTVSRAPGGGWF
jgi:phosphate transport system substrate-binding protein